MIISGVLTEKMRTEWGEPIRYFLVTDQGEFPLNEWIGTRVLLGFTGAIRCVHCGRPIPKTYMQGYCYPCFASLPETSDCVLRPELCRAHEGISRDMAWSEGHCLQEHIVYLADSGGLKVGVTRKSQMPVRWIDQGASRALPVARTPNRFLAGSIEVALKAFLPDKTNFRHMLTGREFPDFDLSQWALDIPAALPGDLSIYCSLQEELVRPRYPVIQYPQKVKSIGLDKQSRVEGDLIGIRGQYLLFASGEVLNIRKHGGYAISMQN